MLQLVDREESHPPIIEVSEKPRKTCDRESCRECHRLLREWCSLPITPPCDHYLRWRYTATHSNSSSLSSPQVHRPVPPQWERPCSHPWSTTDNTTKAVQSSNANSPFMNMFKAFTMIFQQILKELNGAMWEKDRILVEIQKYRNGIKTMKQNDH
jgi:hypothetical protein